MNNRESNQNSNGAEIGILEIINAIIIHKKMVFITFSVAAVLAVIYALLTPIYWKSTASLAPITDSNQGISLNLDMLELLGGGAISNNKSEIAVEYISIMESRTFQEGVINEFDLIKYFRIKKEDPQTAMELAVRRLKKTVKITLDEQSYLVYIVVETKNKTLSRDIANYYISALDDYVQHVKTSKGRLKRIFLEGRVNDVKHQIDSLSTVLKKFQTKSRIIAPDQQTQALISLYADLTTKQLTNDIEIELANQTYGKDSPFLKNLLAQKLYLKDKIAELESQKNSEAFKYIPKIGNLPEYTEEYSKIMINFEIQKKVFEYLYPQYESAKIDEIKDLPSLEVIDNANLPGLRSRPKRAAIVILITFIAFVLSSLIAVMQEFVNKEQKAIWRSIIKNLRISRHE